MERNKRDCAVYAIQQITGKDYSDCLYQLAKSGRKYGKGTPRHVTRHTLQAMGYRVTDVTTRYRDGYGLRTVRTAERGLPEGYFLLFVARHVLAYVDGSVRDWTRGRCHRIQEIWQITSPMEAAPESTPPFRKATPKLGRNHGQNFFDYFVEIC